MKTKETFKIYLLVRQEYKKDFEYIGINDEGEDIFNTKITYTGKTQFLGKNRQELLNINSIPEWKAEIIGEFTAENGHTDRGQHKYDFSRNPITIIT